MSPSPDPEVSEEILEEGYYYLSQVGLTDLQIAGHFETSAKVVRTLIESYSEKLKSGEVAAGEFDKVFWEDVKKEAEGDVKVTFVSEKGFHHSWKSELQRLDGGALMSIYEASKDFLSTDPNEKFLDYPAPKGYDPLAMDREVRKAVAVIGELLEKKWKEEGHTAKR
ncbi:MAG: hypothetical protein OK438_07915 [Thaumarchaeota archaeon]|nr:hypothetical protein [Nitrososphaerota archaeon]